MLQTYLFQLVSSPLIQRLRTLQKPHPGLLGDLSIAVFFVALIAINSLVIGQRRPFLAGIFLFHLFV